MLIFFIKTKTMNQKIIIYVSEGNVCAVYSTDPQTEVILFDNDNIINGDPPPFPKSELNTLLLATSECSAEIKEGKFFQVF